MLHLSPPHDSVKTCQITLDYDDFIWKARLKSHQFYCHIQKQQHEEVLLLLLLAAPLTLVFLSMRSGAARGRASSNRSWYGGAGLCLAPEGPPYSEAKQSGMEQGGGRSSDLAKAPPPSGVEVSSAWPDLESPAGGPGEGSALLTGDLVQVYNADSPSPFATSL